MAHFSAGAIVRFAVQVDAGVLRSKRSDQVWRGQRSVLGAVLLALAFIPTCDAAIVLLNGGSPVIAFGIHATTAVLLVALGGLLLWEPGARRVARAAS